MWGWGNWDQEPEEKVLPTKLATVERCNSFTGRNMQFYYNYNYTYDYRIFYFSSCKNIIMKNISLIGYNYRYNYTSYGLNFLFATMRNNYKEYTASVMRFEQIRFKNFNIASAFRFDLEPYLNNVTIIFNHLVFENVTGTFFYITGYFNTIEMNYMYINGNNQSSSSFLIQSGYSATKKIFINNSVISNFIFDVPNSRFQNVLMFDAHERYSHVYLTNVTFSNITTFDSKVNTFILVKKAILHE